ncbi:hypothetical protein K431DRAFT_281672 [Polychaeton citri CBS 116435]|uniref:Uncharacterized protein n=1 Tax=Polychaeton citri CBS 116435 TaxID=1314669 RepID=A0A9P4UTG8_9PEZI|nr:hypothetical protein K431DRAFT_281672 [Polychaeton citri CBS 116435]
MSKTPGGQGASLKFLKQEAQKHGEGAPNAPGHTDGQRPGKAPVASDSGSTNVGIDNGATNVPGEKGIKGVPVDSKPSRSNNQMAG